MSLSSEMTYRANFYVWILVHSLSLLSLILFFKIIYFNTISINGWTEYQSLLVLGVGTLITGLGSLTFFPFMYSFGEDIINGKLDYSLTKPLDVHFLSSFRWVDIEDLVVTPNSLILITYSLYKLQPEKLFLNLSAFIVLLICSLLLLYALLTFIQSLAIKYMKVDSVTQFFWSIVNISKYPAKSIKNLSLVSMIFLFPVALIASVPAEVLFGRWDIVWIATSLLVCPALFILSRKFFYSSLRLYSSASS